MEGPEEEKISGDRSHVRNLIIIEKREIEKKVRRRLKNRIFSPDNKKDIGLELSEK